MASKRASELNTVRGHVLESELFSVYLIYSWMHSNLNSETIALESSAIVQCGSGFRGDRRFSYEKEGPPTLSSEALVVEINQNR